MPSYPSHLAKTLALTDGTLVTVRPIRPEDAEIEQEFVRTLSQESRYFRFMESLRELSPRMLSHFTQVDYDRHMALIVTTAVNGKETEIAVARYIVEPDERCCEFAIVVADAWQRKGIGSLLMVALMDLARKRGLARMFGEVLAGNQKMRSLMQRLGFRASPSPEDSRLLRFEIDLS